MSNDAKKKTPKKNVEFTVNEMKVVKYIYKQKTNQEMADLLGKSIRTVEGYRENIYKKTNIDNPVGLVIYALKNGICTL